MAVHAPKSVRRTRSRTINCVIRGDWGPATNKQFHGFRGSEKSGNGHCGYHDALLASLVIWLVLFKTESCTASRHTCPVSQYLSHSYRFLNILRQVIITEN